jgi:hypothetical protein
MMRPAWRDDDAARASKKGEKNTSMAGYKWWFSFFQAGAYLVVGGISHLVQPGER